MGDTEYVVIYEVEGFGQRIAGPYLSLTKAELQRDDIAGYEGVSNVFIAEQPKSA